MTFPVTPESCLGIVNGRELRRESVFSIREEILLVGKLRIPSSEPIFKPNHSDLCEGSQDVLIN